jgi:hypothetical protein
VRLQRGLQESIGDGLGSASGGVPRA